MYEHIVCIFYFLFSFALSCLAVGFFLHSISITLQCKQRAPRSGGESLVSGFEFGPDEYSIRCITNRVKGIKRNETAPLEKRRRSQSGFFFGSGTLSPFIWSVHLRLPLSLAVYLNSFPSASILVRLVDFASVESPSQEET